MLLTINKPENDRNHGLSKIKSFDPAEKFFSVQVAIRF